MRLPSRYLYAHSKKHGVEASEAKRTCWHLLAFLQPETQPLVDVLLPKQTPSHVCIHICQNNIHTQTSTITRPIVYTIFLLAACLVARPKSNGSMNSLLIQATFLRGTSALSSKKTENPSLAAELEELDGDRLDTRCRRNGLSKKGGRDMQVPCCHASLVPYERCHRCMLCHEQWRLYILCAVASDTETCIIMA